MSEGSMGRGRAGGRGRSGGGGRAGGGRAGRGGRESGSRGRRAGGGGRELRALRTLARLHGVELRHRDGFDREIRPGPDALVAVLRALGVPLTGVSDAPRALRDENARRAARLLDPVHVLRPGERGSIRRGAGLRVGGRADLRVTTEEGRVREAAVEVEPDRLPVPIDLPEGYHRLEVRCAGETASALLIVAPRRAYAPAGADSTCGAHGGGGRMSSGPERPGGPEPPVRSEWGVFLPLHALRTERDRGIGDLTDLRRLCRWVRDAGGDAVGLLPLFSAFTGEPHEPSPYAPVSRLFWNEIYLDPQRVPEWEASPGARDLWGSPAFRERIRRAREGELVDYREVGARQAELLEHLAATWHANGGDRSEGFRRFLRERPGVQEYAAFRATMEARGTHWDRWPGSWRRDGIPLSAFDLAAYRRHLYAQLRFEEQLADLAGEPCEHAGLYLDLPLGGHAFGYDTWAEPRLFAAGAGIGAPPDGFQEGGQNWGLAPVRPAAARATGHQHFRQVLQRLLPHASHLRIDHVMGLHRLYWVPEGMSASEGVYVRNPADELYAILCLESRRHRTTLIGEDLGTVPEEVPRAMEAHGVRRMHVVPFELDADEPTGMRPVPAGALACLDTHDLPTFAQYWRDGDTRAGLLRAAGLAGVRSRHGAIRADAGGEVAAEAAPLRVLQRLLERLGRSSAGLVIVNLEDLWLEDRPQNVPGGDHPANWRRRAGLSFEETAADPTVRRLLGRLHAARTGAEPRDEMQEASPDDRNDDAGTRGGPMKDRAHERSREGATEAPRSLLTDDDLHLFNEGTHNRLYRKLGAHPSRDPDAPGTRFAVWAPSAERVSVVGDFNGWDRAAHPLEARGASGIWEGRVREAGKGAVYKYEIRSGRAGYRVQKADPFGFRHEVPPATASVVWDLDYDWDDDEWMRARAARNAADAPISVYEVHLGSWRRDRDRPQRLRSYREIAPELARHVRECGFTHVELLPIMEHPFYGSWGYQTTGYFAPTSRHGSPQDFMYFVDHLHQEGIGVLLDWVPSHFPSDEHGLGYFDGTHLFEHADPRQGFHPDWESLIFNFGRNEVRSFLLSSALFWLDRYHVDGIRVDAVASMLYLDYSRKQGEWVPNRFGGRENLEAIEFLRQLNEDVYANYPDVQTIAEESTAWPMVSRPTYVGGLGFGMKWDMGWMHDTLHYFARDPIHRRHHHHELTFRGIYAFNENFMLPLSHDEVVHGKGSLLGRMAGDDWQKKANLRVLLANQALQPGKKLLFMGGELGQWGEWSHDGELDWALLDHPDHAGIRRLVGDLNRRYRDEPALHQGDFRPEGFEWVDTDDSEQSVLSFLRKEIGKDPGPPLLAVFNLTPLPRENYRLGVPVEGRWAEIVNTDAVEYGGTGRGNLGGVDSDPVGSHGRYHSLVLSLPPLAALVLKPEG